MTDLCVPSGEQQQTPKSNEVAIKQVERWQGGWWAWQVVSLIACLHDQMMQIQFEQHSFSVGHDFERFPNFFFFWS